MRLLRHSIAPDYRDAAGKLAADVLRAQPFFQKSEQIACYLAYAGELDTSPMIETIWAANKTCYLPVLVDNAVLQFALYQRKDPLRPNQFGILEPVAGSPFILPTDLQLVIMPLVAFDASGHRLGTGGGYYDKTFAFLRDNARQKPYCIGLAYAAQEVPFIPTDPWDIQLQGIITEKGFIGSS